MRKATSSDLQIVLLGDPIKAQFFATLRRNLLERWQVRYENLALETLEQAGGRPSIQLKIKPSGASAAVALSIEMGPEPTANWGMYDPYELATSFGNASRILLFWLVGEELLEAQAQEAGAESPLDLQLVSLSEVAHAIRQQNQHSERQHGSAVQLNLRIALVRQRNLRFGAKPWLTLSSRQERVAQESLLRRAPRFFHLLQHAFDSIQYQDLPWSGQGSHLDHAPLWIDDLIFRETGLDELKK